MKKLLGLLVITLMVFVIVGCSSTNNEEVENVVEEVVKEPTNVENVDVVGLYEEKHDDNENDYYIMLLQEDGTGALTNMLTGTVISLTYDVNGKDILAHVGSANDESPITYLDENTLSYNEINYNKVDQSTTNIVGVWVSETNNNGEYTKLTIKSDGSGSILNMPMDIGVAFAYEVNNGKIMTHVGSIEDNTPMTFDESTNTIIYENVTYTRIAD